MAKKMRMVNLYAALNSILKKYDDLFVNIYMLKESIGKV